MSTVDCLFCGDPCLVTDNGAYCCDCGIYGYPDEGGRWRIYLRADMVPSGPVGGPHHTPLKWHTVKVTFCTPNPARLGPVMYGDRYGTLN